VRPRQNTLHDEHQRIRGHVASTKGSVSLKTDARNLAHGLSEFNQLRSINVNRKFDWHLHPARCLIVAFMGSIE
jgi:hypothetical protein